MTEQVPPKAPGVNTITSANLPAAPQAPKEVLIDDADIKAKPLISNGDFNFKPANPNHSLRFINRVAGGGQRYDQAKAQGFRNALVADVHKSTPVAAHLQKDGAIINGDLILMLMNRVDYVGALKLNEQRAVARLGRKAVMETGREKMKEALNEVSGSAANKSKVSLYNPGI